nr:MAG TPA_asm: hypothetical protein [Bacteriophage sp.]
MIKFILGFILPYKGEPFSFFIYFFLLGEGLAKLI